MKAPFFKKLKKALYEGKNGMDGLNRANLLNTRKGETYIKLEGKEYRIVNLGEVTATK